MKTDVVIVKNSGEGMSEALNHALAAGTYRGLNAKESLRLRLLTEEMLGMLREITGEAEAKFWVESEGKRFELHLRARPRMTDAMREELLSVSSSGKNAAASGVMGKLRDIFERAFAESDLVESNYYMQGALLTSGMEGLDPLVASANMNMVAWSMNKLKATVASEKETASAVSEEWDELEKSIIANLADEVSIAIRGREVEMTVYKSFER